MPTEQPTVCFEERKSMQRSGIEAIRARIQLSKPKQEISNITNSQNTKRTYGQPIEQLFPILEKEGQVSVVKVNFVSPQYLFIDSSKAVVLLLLLLLFFVFDVSFGDVLPYECTNYFSSAVVVE